MSDDYSIYHQTADGDLIPLHCLKARLNRPTQVDTLDPRVLELTTERNTPIKEGDIIIVEKQGLVLFRGYVKFYSIRNREKEIKVFGMEDLLNYRVTPKFYYDQYQTITWSFLFSDACKSGNIPGLLSIANGYLVPGDTCEVYSGTVMKLVGLGTNSDLASCKLFYIGQNIITSLAKYQNLATLVASSTTTSINYYRDAKDLYIDIGTSVPSRSWWKFGGIIAENYKDTSIRLGKCDPLNTNISDIGLITDWNSIGDLILDICFALGYHVTFTDDRNYTYLNITSTEGRGEDIGGIYTFSDEDLISIEKDEQDEPFTHGLIGRGAAEHVRKLDHHRPGVRAKIERVITFDNEFSDASGKLMSYVEDEYNDQTEIASWTIEPERCDLFFFPGDWIKLKLEYESEMLLKCVNIKEDCLTGQTTLELSAKKTDITDVFDYLNDAEEIFSKMYPLMSAPADTDSDTEVGFTTGTFSFDIPKGVLDADLKPRILLTVSVQEIYSATTTTDLGDIGKINLTITIGTTTTVFCGVPIGTMTSIDVTDSIAAADAAQTVTWTMAPTAPGAPTGAKFTISGTMEFLKRAN